MLHYFRMENILPRESQVEFPRSATLVESSRINLDYRCFHVRVVKLHLGRPNLKRV